MVRRRRRPRGPAARRPFSGLFAELRGCFAVAGMRASAWRHVYVRGSGLVRAVSGAAPGIQNQMWHSVRRPVSLLLPPSHPLPADWLGQWLCMSSCREAAWRSPLPVPLEAAAADGASSVMVQAGQSQETVRQVGVRGGGSASVSASVVPRSIDDVSRVAVPVPADTAWKARSSGPGSMILWIACVFPMLAWA